MPPRLLLTGAEGQLGAEVAALAAQRGLPLLACGRADLDIVDASAVGRRIAEWRPAVVLNCAAMTDVDAAERQPELAMAVNRDGAAHLAAAAAAAGAMLLHVSTDYVFDGSGRRARREGDPVAPLSVYGASKAAGEAAVRRSAPRHLVVRTSWLFGRHGNNFVKTMLRLGRERSEITVVDDQRGRPTPAPALAAALLEMAGQAARPGFDGWGTYHFAGRPALTWWAFARWIFRCAGMDIRVRRCSTAEWGAPARRPADSVLHVGRIRRRFGIAAPDWRPAVAGMVARGRPEP